MRPVRKLLVLSIAIFTSAQTVCATVSYNLTDSENARDCNAILGALKRDNLAETSNQQICEIINSPVTNTLRGKGFRDVAWLTMPYMTRSGIEAIAGYIYDSTLIGRGLHIDNKYKIGYMRTVDKLLSDNNVSLEYADLNYGEQTIYAARLRRRQCNTAYRSVNNIPIWGFFLDKSHTNGLTSKGNIPGGNLFYFNNRLLTLSISPDYWYSKSNISSKKTELSIQIWSMDGSVPKNRILSFNTQLVCSIYIDR